MLLVGVCDLGRWIYGHIEIEKDWWHLQTFPPRQNQAE